MNIIANIPHYASFLRYIKFTDVHLLLRFETAKALDFFCHLCYKTALIELCYNFYIKKKL